MKKLTSSLLVLTLLLGIFSIAFGAIASDGAPVAENLELDTYRAVSVGGKLAAADPDGKIVNFEITTPPGKGEIELSSDGSFIYTPEPGKRGKDYFGYKAVDDMGNYSQEATVIIRIRKQKTNLTYSDMTGDPNAWAATMLAEEDIFTGRCLAGEYVFSPNEEISRGEFLTMCMKAADTRLMYDASTSGFADSDSTPAWARPYIATAARYGFVTGYESDAGVVFSPDESISALEAAVMLDRVMGFTDAVAVWAAMDESVPAWAAQSAANLSARGIAENLTSDPLTRSAAAVMLCKAMLSMDK